MVYPETFQGFAVTDPKDWSTIQKYEYKPKTFTDYDIDVQIEACSVCGSDCHTASNGWGSLKVLPIVVGHEIVGKVVKKGSKVNSVELGDRVGVGAQAFACLECEICKGGDENYCPESVKTYNASYKDGSVSQGGYASHVRVHEHFAFKVPENLDSNTTASLFCAGATVFAALKQAGAGDGKKIGVVGIGGLGHWAIMIAKAMGAEVYTFSRGEKKREDALKLGSDLYIPTGSGNWNKDYKYKLDGIVCTANSTSNFNMSEYLACLRMRGKWVNVGLPEEPFQVHPRAFLTNACYMSGTLLGSRAEILELLQLASDKGIKAWVETVPISAAGVKDVLERCHNNDVKYRFTLTDFDKQF